MGRRKMHKRPGEKAYVAPPPKVPPCDGPYEVVEKDDDLHDYEIDRWLNAQLKEGLELVTAIPIVGVKHQFACTVKIKYIFRRIR